MLTLAFTKNTIYYFQSVDAVFTSSMLGAQNTVNVDGQCSPDIKHLIRRWVYMCIYVYKSIANCNC